MKNLDLIAEELFNKVRGRFPSVTIGDQEGNVTNIPKDARYFDFDYKEGNTSLGKVSISLTDEAVEIMYADNFVSEQDEITKNKWYDFLKELRQFSKKRLLKFDTRNINKSNLDRRDYQFLAKNRGDSQMSESKLYGTSRISYQDVDSARLIIKHTESVNQELASGRTRKIGKIYIESSEGEKFIYPYKHLSGARAMARHVAEGGKPYDDFGKHIVGLSEEMNKLRKFKTYMGRSSVMAEGLADYMPVIKDRIVSVKKTLESLQRSSHYKYAFENFENPIFEEVPEDVAENWIDQLTVKQFNEELSDVFPYIYKLVSEATRAKVMTAESFVDEDYTDTYTVQPGDTLYSIAREMVKYEMKGMSVNDAVQMIADDNGIDDPAMIKPGMELQIPWVTGAVGGDPMTGEPITRGLPPEAYESELDSAFEEMMGQFSDKINEAGNFADFESKFRRIQKRGGNVAVSIHGLLKDSGLDADQIMGFDPNVPSNRTKVNQFQQGNQERVLQKVQQALGSAQGGQAQPAAGGEDLGDGFQAVDADVAGQKVKGVLDTQSGSTIVLNKGIVRSPGKYLIIDQSGKMQSTMQVGPMTQKALQAAGLDEGMVREAAGCSCNDGGKCTCPSSCTDCNCNESTDEGNKFAAALKKARDNDEDEMEVDGKKIPVTEFILSMYDRETGQFPKGETAVLTAVEKDYGEQYINPAKSFIEAVNAKFEEFNGYRDPELMDDQDNLGNVITTGVKGSYDFIAKSIKDFEELIRNNPNHPKVPQVKAELAKLKPQLAQARKDSGMGETEDLRRLAGI